LAAHVEFLYVSGDAFNQLTVRITESCTDVALQQWQYRRQVRLHSTYTILEVTGVGPTSR
jgi:hypothetical protein